MDGMPRIWSSSIVVPLYSYTPPIQSSLLSSHSTVLFPAETPPGDERDGC